MYVCVCVYVVVFYVSPIFGHRIRYILEEIQLLIIFWIVRWLSEYPCFLVVIIDFFLSFSWVVKGILFCFQVASYHIKKKIHPLHSFLTFTMFV